MAGGAATETYPQQLQLTAGTGARVIASVAGTVAETHGGASRKRPVDDEAWILMVDEDDRRENEMELRGWTLVLVDSGACMHVAPLDFAVHLPLEEAPDIELRAANGEALQILGLRRVGFWTKTQTGHAVQMVVPFVICDVARPIMSVGGMLDKGLDVSFSPPGVRRADGQLVELVRRDTRFFLPVAWSRKEALLKDSVYSVDSVDGVVDAPRD